jgi:hypothetical protein
LAPGSTSCCPLPRPRRGAQAQSHRFKVDQSTMVDQRTISPIVHDHAPSCSTASCRVDPGAGASSRGDVKKCASRWVNGQDGRLNRPEFSRKTPSKTPRRPAAPPPSRPPRRDPRTAATTPRQEERPPPTPALAGGRERSARAAPRRGGPSRSRTIADKDHLRPVIGRKIAKNWRDPAPHSYHERTLIRASICNEARPRSAPLAGRDPSPCGWRAQMIGAPLVLAAFGGIALGLLAGDRPDGLGGAPFVIIPAATARMLGRMLGWGSRWRWWCTGGAQGWGAASGEGGGGRPPPPPRPSSPHFWKSAMWCKYATEASAAFSSRRSFRGPSPLTPLPRERGISVALSR